MPTHINDENLTVNIFLPAVIALITVLLTMGSIFIWAKEDPSSFSRTFINGAVLTDSDLTQSTQYSNTSFEQTIVDTVKKADPAVVSIIISKDMPIYEKYYGAPDPFEEYFGRIPRYRQNGTEKRDIGAGSGFIVSPDGYIVTNSHVVDINDAEYSIVLSDGNHHNAEIVMRDQELDIAIIKIEKNNLPYLTFGDSNKLEIGQSVVAIGNALAEFRNSVSLGIVSGLSRSIVAADSQGNTESLDQLIQTDAAINEGNSGGPLLNLNGEVIGVNVAVARGAENIGFAINGNKVKEMLDSIK